jgi:hypothetical protein
LTSGLIFGKLGTATYPSFPGLGRNAQPRFRAGFLLSGSFISRKVAAPGCESVRQSRSLPEIKAAVEKNGKLWKCAGFQGARESARPLLICRRAQLEGSGTHQLRNGMRELCTIFWPRNGAKSQEHGHRIAR